MSCETVKTLLDTSRDSANTTDLLRITQDKELCVWHSAAV